MEKAQSKDENNGLGKMSQRRKDTGRWGMFGKDRNRGRSFVVRPTYSGTA
jgi:hypothetical protein